MDPGLDLAQLAREGDRELAPLDRVLETVVKHVELRARAVGHRQLRPGRDLLRLHHRKVAIMLGLATLAAAPMQRRQPAQVEAHLGGRAELAPQGDRAVERFDDRLVVEQCEARLIGPVLVELRGDGGRHLGDVLQCDRQVGGRLLMRTEAGSLHRGLRREFHDQRAILRAGSMVQSARQLRRRLRSGKACERRADLGVERALQAG